MTILDIVTQMQIVMLTLSRWILHQHVVRDAIPPRIYKKRNMSSVFSINSRANAPELIENTQEMFPHKIGS